MQNLIRSRNLLSLLVAATAFIVLESSASAWPVNRFYRTGNTNTVMNALRNYERTGQLLPPSPIVHPTQRRPVNRFYRSRPTHPAPTYTARPRFFLFDLFR